MNLRVPLQRVFTLVVLGYVGICCQAKTGKKLGRKDAGAAKTQQIQPHTPTEPSPPPKVLPLRPPPPLPVDKGRHGGQPKWSERYGNLGRDNGRSVAVDAAGNIAMGGLFSGEVDFGSGTTWSAQGTDGYAVVYSPQGKFLWGRSFGGQGDDVVSSVAFDPKGNLIVAGWFSHSITLGERVLESAGADDLFVAKLRAGGDLVWAHHYGGIDVDAVDAIAVSPQGDIVVAGVFRQTITLGGNVHKSTGGADIFLFKLDAMGKLLWSRSIGSYGLDYARDVAIVAQGGIILSGEFSGTLRFRGQTLVSNGDRDVFLGRFDSAGNHIWSKGFGGPFPELAFGLAVDSGGHIVVSGSYFHEINFGGPTHRSAGESDIFLARFAYDGSYLWSKSFGEHRKDSGLGVATDGFGNIVFTGFFQEKVTFGQRVLVSAGNKDIFVAKLAPTGKLLWSQRFGARDHDQGRAITLNQKGETIVVGTFRFEMEVGDSMLHAAYAKGDLAPKGDVFLMRLAR